LLQHAPTDRAASEASFRQAADVARRQGAKTLELRAASSLARLLRREGQFEEGRPLLAAVYNGLTEGSDTLELQDAKFLLDEGL
jgi:adenylate cyclase